MNVREQTDLRPPAHGEVGDSILLVAALLTPPLLLHARAGAEISIAIVGIGYLLRCARLRDWGWVRQGWVPFGLAWWGWIVLCSVPVPALGLGPGGAGSLLQAVLTVRFLVFVVALERCVLRTAQARLWLAWVNAAAVLWVVAQTVLQFAVGVNLFGQPRSVDGELTGPFREPIAGPTLARIIFPSLVPATWQRLQRPRVAARIVGGALILGSIAVTVLIGQRMPLLLTVLGLLTTALFLPRLRVIVVAALVAAGVLVGATVVVSPPTYYRLVLKFSRQMDHFGESPYGMIYGRALAIAVQHPLTGRGFDGYRSGCTLPRYWHGWPQDPASTVGASPQVCVQHPHNFYMQALVDGGVPGLVLFAALAVRWMAALGRGLWRQPEPRRVGLLAAAVVTLWPLASTSAFTAMPVGGWFFLLLGWGLAEARAAADGQPAAR